MEYNQEQKKYSGRIRNGLQSKQVLQKSERVDKRSQRVLRFPLLNENTQYARILVDCCRDSCKGCPLLCRCQMILHKALLYS